MPILNQQRRDEIVRIATCGICQTEYELQFFKGTLTTENT